MKGRSGEGVQRMFGAPRRGGRDLRAGTLLILAGSLVVLVSAPHAAAQDQPPTQQPVPERVEALEKENQELRSRLEKVEANQQAAMKAAEGAGILKFEQRPDGTTPPRFDFRKYAAAGDFPGSITIPGTKISFQIGGFAQLDANFDTHNIGSEDSFIVSTIPTDNEGAGQTHFSVRQTRLFLKTSAPTDEFGTFVTYVEGDLFNSDGSSNPRVRHAYGEIGDTIRVLGGQTWTTFMDASTYPAIFDYQGPNGMVLVRQPMLRLTATVAEGWEVAAAVEDPNPDVTGSPGLAGESTARWPDFTGNVRWSPEWGHLQLAGILRELTFDPVVGSRDTAVGWGLNFTGAINLGKEVAKGRQDNILFQIAGGQGIANYYNDSSGLGFDAVGDATGNLDALDIWGGFAAYQHFWTPRIATTIGYSYLQVETESIQPVTDYESGHYAVGNVWFYASQRVLLGVEGLYGIREDIDGDNGDDFRLTFAIQYRF